MQGFTGLRSKTFFFALFGLFFFKTALCYFLATTNPTPTITYRFTNDPIDIIIPCATKDAPTLDLVIDGIKKNGRNIRRVIVVSKKHLTKKAEWFDESRFPFSFASMAEEIFQDKQKAEKYCRKPHNRLGWLFQQLIKFYSFYVIDNLSPNILVLDADTIFLNPVTFTNEFGAAQFNVGTERHRPYFMHAKRLLPGFKKIYPRYSGICHFMLLQKPVIAHLFNVVENEHHIEFWKAFLRQISLKQLNGSSASEYEIYFNFAFMTSAQFSIHKLKWKNLETTEHIDYYKNKRYNYVSCHTFMRKEDPQ